MTAQNADRAQLFTLRFEERPGYVYAFVEGQKDSYEISRQYWKAVADECRRVKSKKVLIEENITDELSTTDTYQLTSEMMELGFSGIRVAFVDRHFTHQDSNKFGELVATNRGLIVKVFANVEQATEWLLS